MIGPEASISVLKIAHFCLTRPFLYWGSQQHLILPSCQQVSANDLPGPLGVEVVGIQQLVVVGPKASISVLNIAHFCLTRPSLYWGSRQQLILPSCQQVSAHDLPVPLGVEVVGIQQLVVVGPEASISVLNIDHFCLTRPSLYWGS